MSDKKSVREAFGPVIYCPYCPHSSFSEWDIKGHIETHSEEHREAFAI